MDALVQSGRSYGEGIQLKMVLTKMIEWARHKIGSDVGTLVEQELEAVRQAANVLCLLQKGDLAQDDFRETVCPLLRPKHIWLLLQSYRTDQFDNSTIPASLLSQLKQKEETYKVTQKTFDFETQKEPFELDFIPQLDFSSINVPKVVSDRPGFAFLKSFGAVCSPLLTNSNTRKW